MSEKRRIVVNTLANGVAQFAALIASFVFMPFLIRGFGITGFGLYLLASSIVAYGILLDLGVGASVVKMTADAAARGHREDLSSVISSALVFYLLIGIAVAAIMTTLALNAASVFHTDPSDSLLLRNLFLVAGAVSLWTWPLSLTGHVLTGFQKFTQKAYVSTAAILATIAVTAIVVVLHQGPVVLMIGNAAVSLVSSLVQLLLARRALGDVRVSVTRANVSGLRSVFSFAWAVFAIQVCTVIVYQQTDRLVLGIFVGAATIALYEAAGKFQGLVAQLTTFTVSAVMPLASQLEAEGRQDTLRSLFLRGTKYSLALVNPVVIVLVVVARPLLQSWLGATFAAQALAAQLLISHQLLTSGVAVGDAMIVGLGQLGRRVPYAVAMALLNLTISLALVQRFGILGVVLGTTIPYLIDFPFHMRLILKVLDVPLSRWLRETILPTYPLLLIPLAVSLVLLRTPLSASLLGIAAIGILSVSLYWMAVVTWGFNREERDELRSAVNGALARLLASRTTGNPT